MDGAEVLVDVGGQAVTNLAGAMAVRGGGVWCDSAVEAGTGWAEYWAHAPW